MSRNELCGFHGIDAQSIGYDDVVGTIEIFGAALTAKPVVRSAGTCMCSCPNCGTHLCLTVQGGAVTAVPARQVLGRALTPQEVADMQEAQAAADMAAAAQAAAEADMAAAQAQAQQAQQTAYASSSSTCACPKCGATLRLVLVAKPSKPGAKSAAPSGGLLHNAMIKARSLFRPNQSVSGYHILGAFMGAAPNPTAPRPKSRDGVQRGLTRAQHVAVEKRASGIANRAARSGISAYKAGQSFSPNRRAVIGAVLVGALRNPGKPLTPKQQAAVEKLNRAVEVHKQASALALKKGAAAAAAAKKVAGALQKHGAAIQTSATRRPSKTILGFESTVVFGAPMFDPQTGTYFDSATGQDIPPPAGANAAEGWTPPAGGATDPAAPGTSAIEQKTYNIPSSGLGKDAEQIRHHVVPHDAVVYTGDHGYPSGTKDDLTFMNDGFVSWNLVYGGGDLPEGYYFRGSAGAGETGLQGGWRYRGNNRSNTAAAKKFKEVSNGYHNGHPSASSGFGTAYGWGPLIGNPRTTGDRAWTHGLKFAMDEGKWFWLRDDAPEWATHNDDVAAEETRKAADEAAQAQAEADAAEKAKRDATKQEADAQAAAERALADEASAKEQAKSDADWQREQDRAALQQQQVDAQAAIQREQAQLEIDKIRAANEVEMARFAAQQPQGGGGGVPPGSDGYDQGDGSYPVPADYDLRDGPPGIDDYADDLVPGGAEPTDYP